MPRQTIKKAEISDGQKNKAVNNEPPPAPVTLANPVASYNAQGHSQGGKSPEPQQDVSNPVHLAVRVEKSWSDYAYIGGSLLLTLMTLVIALIAFNQARTAKAQAKAAQLSAQAIMDSERPWLLIEKTATRDRIQDPDLLRAQQMAMQNRLPNCVFYLRNYGKTVAKMTSWEYALQIGDIPTVPPDKSIYDFRTNQTFIPDVLPQGRSVGQYATFKTIPPDSEFDAVDAGTKFLWLCGAIRYLSASGTEYRTKFCYLWERRMTTPKPFWRVAGPKEYTEAT
jgi:hypothetical protein